jgi:hypothetical protein
LLRKSDEAAFEEAGVCLGEVGVLAGEHDGAIPEVLAALLLGPGVLLQAGSHLIALADVSQCPAKASRIIAEQDVDACPGCLGPLEQRGQIRAQRSDYVTGPVHDLRSEQPARGAICQVQAD